MDPGSHACIFSGYVYDEEPEIGDDGQIRLKGEVEEDYIFPGGGDYYYRPTVKK